MIGGPGPASQYMLNTQFVNYSEGASINPNSKPFETKSQIIPYVPMKQLALEPVVE